MIRTIELPQGVRSFRSRGSEGAAVAVFLHPFMLNSRYWLDSLGSLCDLRRCIAPDLPGFGESEPLAGDRIDLNEYAADLWQLLDALGVDAPVDLVGSSAAGLVAALAARAQPARVRSLTLLSSRFVADLGEGHERYKAEMARLLIVEGKDAVFRRFVEYVVGPSMSLLARARYKSMLTEARFESLIAFLTRMRVDLPADLAASLRQPVLLVAGEQDSFVDARSVRDSAADFPDATVRLVADSGRFPPLENPTAFNAALRGFWSAQRRSEQANTLGEREHIS